MEAMFADSLSQSSVSSVGNRYSAPISREGSSRAVLTLYDAERVYPDVSDPERPRDANGVSVSPRQRVEVDGVRQRQDGTRRQPRRQLAFAPAVTQGCVAPVTATRDGKPRLDGAIGLPDVDAAGGQDGELWHAFEGAC